MLATNRLNQVPYEDVLKQLLAEVVELRKKIEINANQSLQKYQGNYPEKLPFNYYHVYIVARTKKFSTEPVLPYVVKWVNKQYC